MIISNGASIGNSAGSRRDRKRSGQTALVEKLQGGLDAFRGESQLVAVGLTRYVEEQDLVRFYKQSDRGLRLDWVRNFTRIIPDAVLETKLRCDELKVFDNYVVLHYDPEAKSFAETEAERAKRRDPILFGVIRGSTALYFVGDWIDELCDLTLHQIADARGAGAVKVLA